MSVPMNGSRRRRAPRARGGRSGHTGSPRGQGSSASRRAWAFPARTATAFPTRRGSTCTPDQIDSGLAPERLQARELGVGRGGLLQQQSFAFRLGDGKGVDAPSRRSSRASACSAHRRSIARDISAPCADASARSPASRTSCPRTGPGRIRSHSSASCSEAAAGAASPGPVIELAGFLQKPLLPSGELVQGVDQDRGHAGPLGGLVGPRGPWSALDPSGRRLDQAPIPRRLQAARQRVMAFSPLVLPQGEMWQVLSPGAWLRCARSRHRDPAPCRAACSATSIRP